MKQGVNKMMMPEDCLHKIKYLTLSKQCYERAEMCSQKCPRKGHEGLPHDIIQISQLSTQIKSQADRKLHFADQYLEKLKAAYQQRLSKLKSLYEQAKKQIMQINLDDKENQMLIRYVDNNKWHSLSCSHVYKLKNLQSDKGMASKQAQRIIEEFMNNTKIADKQQQKELIQILKKQFIRRLEKYKNKDEDIKFKKFENSCKNLQVQLETLKTKYEKLDQKKSNIVTNKSKKLEKQKQVQSTNKLGKDNINNINQKNNEIKNIIGESLRKPESKINKEVTSSQASNPTKKPQFDKPSIDRKPQYSNIVKDRIPDKSQRQSQTAISQKKLNQPFSSIIKRLQSSIKPDKKVNQADKLIKKPNAQQLASPQYKTVSQKTKNSQASLHSQTQFKKVDENVKQVQRVNVSIKPQVLNEASKAKTVQPDNKTPIGFKSMLSGVSSNPLDKNRSLFFSSQNQNNSKIGVEIKPGVQKSQPKNDSKSYERMPQIANNNYKQTQLQKNQKTQSRSGTSIQNKQPIKTLQFSAGLVSIFQPMPKIKERDQQFGLFDNPEKNIPENQLKQSQSENQPIAKKEQPVEEFHQKRFEPSSEHFRKRQ